MEEMLNNQKHKKLTKKLPKGQTISPEGWNQLLKSFNGENEAA